ncbi:MAG TPA: hypothetical protein VGZ72_17160 [Stellaceae bacterium]|nr:hypothetical protein [Stellaceae bacterium]
MRAASADRCRAAGLCAAGALGFLLFDSIASAQTPAPSPTVTTQSASNFSYETKDGQQTVTITNVTFQAIDPYLPGRKDTKRLVLRTATRTTEVIDEIGIQGSVTVEAWPLGTDLSQKPRYGVTLEAAGAKAMNQSILVFERGLEEVQWWSVYDLEKGQHLFDTYVPVVEFSISREFDTPRFAGFETPPDDAADKRLTEPHVVGVLTYASAERVIREALLTCDDPKRADNFRSYADANRELALVEGPVPPAKGRAQPEPTRTLKITFSQSYPSPPNPVTAVIPIGKDDLDLTNAKLPACMHAAAWKR